MAIALHSYKIDTDGVIRVRHTFYANSEPEADKLMEQHGAGCKAFGPALEAGETIEIVEEIDELPDPDVIEALEDDVEDDEPEEDEDEEAGEDDADAERE